MRTLWNGEWIETPRPHRVAGSVLLEVEASAPVLRLGAVHGREFGSPVRKVASFTLTDGPAATARKALAKRAEPTYTGDYHLTIALGRVAGADDPALLGTRVLALAPRAPRCASALLVADALARPAGELQSAALPAIASALAAERDRIAPLVRQSYLYSAMPPPAELVEALERAAAATTEAAAEPLRPSHLDDFSSDAIRVARPLSANGTPVAVLGAGDYVRIEVAPNLAGTGLRRAVLADREPQIAALAAAELGFQAATTNAAAAIDRLDGRGLVIVATAHDSHAALASRALAAGHRVICEKPAVVNADDLDLILDAAEAHPGELDLGFNRRHNPLVERARRELASARGPMTLLATIREVDITPDHWYLWPNQGTRAAGNLCHWIDLAVHLLGPGPEPVSLAVSPAISHEPISIDAERIFTVTFDEGSVASFVLTARGDPVRGVQEQLEARCGDLTLRLDDLWKLSGLRSGLPLRRRTLWRDKGHARMYATAVSRLLAGQPATYPIEDLRRGAEIQLAATELIRSDRSVGQVRELVEASRFR